MREALLLLTMSFMAAQNPYTKSRQPCEDYKLIKPYSDYKVQPQDERAIRRATKVCVDTYKTCLKYFYIKEQGDYYAVCQ